MSGRGDILDRISGICESNFAARDPRYLCGVTSRGRKVNVKIRGARIGEVSCPTSYFPEASSIGFLRSCEYGFGVLKTSIGALPRRLVSSRRLPVEAEVDAAADREEAAVSKTPSR